MRECGRSDTLLFAAERLDGACGFDWYFIDPALES